MGEQGNDTTRAIRAAFLGALQPQHSGGSQARGGLGGFGGAPGSAAVLEGSLRRRHLLQLRGLELEGGSERSLERNRLAASKRRAEGAEFREAQRFLGAFFFLGRLLLQRSLECLQ